MYFIKLILIAIIFEFLTCFGINNETDKEVQHQVASDSLLVIVSDTAYVYKLEFEGTED